MSRRSNRLQEAHYYTEQGSPSVSYKERLYKVFRKRTNRTSTLTAQIRTPQILTPQILTPETQAVRTTTPQTQTLTTQAVRTTTPQTQTLTAISTATTGTQTTRPNRKKVKTTYGFVFGFLSLLLLALAFTHMQLQMAELKQDMQSLGQRLDTVPPPAFTHMQLQMAELKQDMQSLRQRLDTVSLPADNMPNFALESQGARVMPGLSSETYWPKMNSIYSRFYRSKLQVDVIRGRSSLHPGECWSFSGSRGHLFISLSHPVSVTHVSLGHITKSQHPGGFIASAPREFSVYGLQTTDEEGTFLGKLVYDPDGAAVQTFQLTNPDNGVFRHVKLQIENNWGNEDYTCLYSFRVHGNLPT